jgi:multiple sugar transport system ATP-binding protein
MASVRLSGVSKIFGQTTVLQNIDLTIHDQEFMVLVGPSGCGKSTLLRLIAGLEPVSTGSIYLGERQIDSLPPKARDIAMVFQSYALYPHMTVYDNIAFGLKRQKQQGLGFLNQIQYQKNKSAIAVRVQEVAKSLQIETLLQRKPAQLSGGQKQRVALGRAIARNPQVFLMDEPLSNLDAQLRSETRSQLVQLHSLLQTTTIYVTHDQTEAMTMGTRIVVLKGGKIQQVDTPLNLYRRPANQFVASFIGSPAMNFIPVNLDGDRVVSDYLSVELSDRLIIQTSHSVSSQQPLIMGFRPEHIKPSSAESFHVCGVVVLIEALGAETNVIINVKGGSEPIVISAKVTADLIFAIGQTTFWNLDQKLYLFDANSGETIRHPY